MVSLYVILFSMYSNLKRPLSVSFLITLLELGGVINLKTEEWKKKLQDVYCRLQTFLILTFSFLHLYNTIHVWTRSEQYDKLDLFQCIYEDFAITNGCLQILFLKQKVKDLILLTNKTFQACK